MYYVTMTDKFMSNWGMAKGKINKLIFECETYDEAVIVLNNAISRTDMKYVNIVNKKPYYSPKINCVQVKTKDEYPCWYKENYFKR